MIHEGEEKVVFLFIYTSSFQEILNNVVVFHCYESRHKFINIDVNEHITISWVSLRQLNKRATEPLDLAEV
jgi:hypothetical protein